MKNFTEEELRGGLYQEVLSFAEQGRKVIYSSRNFIITIFTITAAFFGGILSIDLKVNLNNLGLIGLFLIFLNLIVIPIQFWRVTTKEFDYLKRSYDLFLSVYKRDDLKPTKEEIDEFMKLRKRKDEEDYFRVVYLLFIIGTSLFLLSIMIQFLSIS